MVDKFYAAYPSIRTDDPLNSYTSTTFNDAIVTKREFADERLDRVESRPTTPGQLLRHQKYISRFLAAGTGYNELLLFHEPGTGKTCTAVAVAEGLVKDYKAAIVCSKGEGLNKNFLQELVFTCTDGKYVPDGYDELTDAQRAARTKRIVSKFYRFKTFETFAKELSDLNDAQIRDRYENHVFIVDEVHNMREDTGGIVYAQFHRLFHVTTRRKVLLMSGTPIKDTPNEFASVMNLLLPINEQFDTDDFVERYFTRDGQIKTTKRDEFAQKIRGRVSYLSSTVADVRKEFVGSTIGNLKHFTVYVDTMSEFQTRAYIDAYERDAETRSIYTNSRQAALVVFPDGSIGSNGFDKYIVERKDRYESTAAFNAAVSTVDALQRLSSKYASVVRLLKTSKKAFVFCQYVNGGGLIVLANILEQYGYSAATGFERVKRKRYALCTHQTATNSGIQRMINRYNEDVTGDYISVVLGSRVLNEGFTLKNVDTIIILTPHWNYAETAQAIARGWRFGSHAQLLTGKSSPVVKVYQCVSMPATTTVPSIDLEMYETAETKDVINRQIERLVKESAFDCPLAKARNAVVGYDGKRECDYQTCNYSCDGNIQSPLDESTFNLLPDVLTSVKNDVLNRLVTQFKTKSSCTVDDVRPPNISDFLMTRIIKDIIQSNDILVDKFGFDNFLRSTGTSIYLTTNPRLTDAFGEYYANNRILKNGDSFDDALKELYAKSLPDKVTQLFAYPSMTRTLLIALPKLVQRTILFACIMAKEKKRNVAVKQDILDFYSGFYSQQRLAVYGDTWVVWLYSDEFGTYCLDKTRNEFIECKQHIKPVSQMGIKTPIGWYGLYNPASRDFCIRDVTQQKTTTDLRAITVGRRCINYEFTILLDIVAKRMMVNPPGDGPFTENDRVTYWSGKNKIELCGVMKDWFFSKELLETNFDCGSQKKRRAKFQY